MCFLNTMHCWLGYMTCQAEDLPLPAFSCCACSAVTNLTGLENLTTVGGLLNIATNPQLTSLAGLEALRSVGAADDSHPFTSSMSKLSYSTLLYSCCFRFTHFLQFFGVPLSYLFQLFAGGR